MLGDISDGIERVCWGIYQMVSSVCVCVCVCVCGGRGAEDVSEGIEGMSEGVRVTCYVREKMLCEVKIPCEGEVLCERENAM